ncbi:YveK family protein [Mesobacillus subterraneus]|uniref:Capsular biosynthesis protein n=1 Tax=Mesobacillus subterraneus TaxID=285983 RepID=A0A427TRI1_9BACI|nr:Wzz/FepE/Etk N-terminal domain-containing protein [Mesobacillus subterraneus]RSD26979.1 capsular biosynthesis protein [Mesobacillus subterraneus]
MEEIISLRDLLGILRKRLILILSITFTTVCISAIVSFIFLTPVYQASTQILVNQSKNDQNGYNASDVQTNLQFINTYNVIIKSPAILNPVIDKLNLNMTSAQLNEKISVGSEKNSQVVNITVRDEKVENAVKIANTVAKVFKSEITDIMSVDNVSILSPATAIEGQSPIKPRPLINISIALIIGMMAGIGLALLLDYMDNTIKNEQDIERFLRLPVIGIIATIDNNQLDYRDSGRKTRTSRTRGDSVGF